MNGPDPRRLVRRHPGSGAPDPGSGAALLGRRWIHARMSPMSRRFIITAVLLLAASVLWGAPAWSHPALEVAVDVASATPASTLAWSSAPTLPAVPWPALLGAAALVFAWWRPRRALALGIVMILAVLAFENGVHSVHHLNQVRHLDDLRSSSTCPVAAATAHIAGTLVD